MVPAPSRSTPSEGSAQPHTPGPWWLATRNGSAAIAGAATEWIAILPYVMSDSFGLTDLGEINANARLIAAAPELLAALKAIEAGALTGRIDLGEAKYGFGALIGKAIAKAEGRS